MAPDEGTPVRPSGEQVRRVRATGEIPDLVHLENSRVRAGTSASRGRPSRRAEEGRTEKYAMSPAMGADVRLERIGELELVYTETDQEWPFPEGGQVYGILTGRLEAEGLRGTIHATNLARQRPDGAFTPALRGVVTTPDGVKLFFTMDGLSIRDPKATPPRRVVTTGITLWTPDPKYRAWNDVYLVAETLGRPIGSSWGVSGDLYRCVSEL